MRRETRDEVANEVRDHIRSGTVPCAEAVMVTPVAHYTDPAHQAHEIDAVFRRHPILFGRSSEMAATGDFVARDIAGVPVLVVRQADGTAAAFINVCRHRGARLAAEPCGHRTVFTCPFHAWAFRIDGSLAKIAHNEHFGTVDTSQLNLTRLPVQERHGLLWVRLTPGAPIDVAEFLGAEFDAEIASYRADGFVVERTHHMVAPMNWKLALEGFLETYHVSIVHRNTVGKRLWANLAPFRAFGPHGRMVTVLKSFEKIIDEPTADAARHIGPTYQIFPNTALVWTGTHFESWSSFPGKHPGECNVTVQVWARPEAIEQKTENFERSWQSLQDIVLSEDFPMAKSVQCGFSSGAQTQVVFGRNEPALQHFHRSLRAAM